MAQQARNEIDQKVFEIFIASWARWDAQWKGLVELERRCQETSQEMRMLNERQGELKVQSRANERLHDQIIEEIKEMEHKKTEESGNISVFCAA